MKKSINLQKYKNVRVISDKLLVLYEKNYENPILVKRDSFEELYPELNFYGIITQDNSGSVYHTNLKKRNVALIEKKIENQSGIRITKNNQICYNFNYEIIRTPIDLTTGKFIYENAWYQFWDYSVNLDKVIFVRGGDSFNYQILNKEDGKPLFPGLYLEKYEPCPSYQNRTYKITRLDGMVSLLDTYTGKLVFGNVWFKDCCFINKVSYLLTYQDGTKRISQVYSGYRFQTDRLDVCEILSENFIKIRKVGDKLSTIINTQDFTPIFDNVYFYDWIDFNPYVFLVTREDGMATVIKKSDGQFVYGDNTWYNNWKLFHKYYKKIKVAREDGLFTLIDKETGKIIKEDLWYKDYDLFIDNKIIATNFDNLSTLIDEETLEVVYNNLLFKEIYDFSDKYFLIIDKKGSKNLIKKSDGSLVFDFYISPYDSEIIFLNDNSFLIKDGYTLKIINTIS